MVVSIEVRMVTVMIVSDDGSDGGDSGGDDCCGSGRWYTVEGSGTGGSGCDDGGSCGFGF